MSIQAETEGAGARTYFADVDHAIEFNLELEAKAGVEKASA